jgi:hypothetical protein
MGSGRWPLPNDSDKKICHVLSHHYVVSWLSSSLQKGISSMKKTKRVGLIVVAVCGGVFASLMANAQSSKPNVLVIWGDDIGYWNLSSNNDGMMGYQTPNIDSIADQGAKFTDAYSEQSCTAGRSAFVTGQHPIRTGLLKVGLPGA